jgi:lipooligosaccharide transport system permease protein
MDGSSPWTRVWLTLIPLHHLAEGVRVLLVAGRLSAHLIAAALVFLLMILVLVPADLRPLCRRLLGER